LTKKGVVDWWVSVNTVIGSIARSAKRQYLRNTEADFESFCPAAATRFTDGVKLSTDCKKVNRKWKLATGNRN